MIFPPNFSGKREWLLTIPITPPEKCISDPKHDHLTRPKYTSRNIKKYWKWTTFNSQQFPKFPDTHKFLEAPWPVQWHKAFPGFKPHRGPEHKGNPRLIHSSNHPNYNHSGIETHVLGIPHFGEIHHFKKPPISINIASSNKHLSTKSICLWSPAAKAIQTPAVRIELKQNPRGVWKLHLKRSSTSTRAGKNATVYICRLIFVSMFCSIRAGTGTC